jgi:hypothetical protein
MLKIVIRVGFMESCLYWLCQNCTRTMNRAAVVGWIKSRRDGSTINEIIRTFFAIRAVVDPLRLIPPYRLVLVHGSPLFLPTLRTGLEPSHVLSMSS